VRWGKPRKEVRKSRRRTREKKKTRKGKDRKEPPVSGSKGKKKKHEEKHETGPSIRVWGTREQVTSKERWL